MAQTKVTFTFDQETIDRINRIAERLGATKSGVVREAVKEYAAHVGRLSEDERRRMLAALDRMMSRPATRSAADVDREIAAVREARRRGGRATPSRR